MSSPTQIQSVRTSEQRYPSDLVHNGHQYIHGHLRDSPEVRKAIRRIRSERRIAELEAVTGCRILRLHRIGRIGG